MKWKGNLILRNRDRRQIGRLTSTLDVIELVPAGHKKQSDFLSLHIKLCTHVVPPPDDVSNLPRPHALLGSKQRLDAKQGDE